MKFLYFCIKSSGSLVLLESCDSWLLTSSTDESSISLDVSLRRYLSGGELKSRAPFVFFLIMVPRLNAYLIPDTNGTSGERPLSTISASFLSFSCERALVRRLGCVKSRTFLELTLGLISPYYDTAEYCCFNLVGERLLTANN